MPELLLELVRRYSPSTQEAPAVEYLVEWMQAHDFHAEIDDAGNAVGIRGQADAPNTLMLLGHIDTVPGEIPVRIEPLPPPPSPYTERDSRGYLVGRGSVDAKGSLCAFAEAAAQASIPAGWRVVVVGAVEEETATSKGAHYIKDRFSPQMCIVGEPSGADRITLGYKGRLLVDYVLARSVAHTARPEPSVGALGAAFWQRILDWSGQQNEGIQRYFDQVMPSLRSINTSTDHFQDRLRMTVGFRLPPRLSPEDVFAAISVFAEPDGELHPYSMERAYQGDRNNALVRRMLAAIRARGRQPGFVLKTGTSDMNVVGEKWTCPIIAYGPGDSDLDHTAHEHLPLDEYNAAVTALRHFVEGLVIAR
jgi:LysW-gamma-L-lysine carboxypeptidase